MSLYNYKSLKMFIYLIFCLNLSKIVLTETSKTILIENQIKRIKIKDNQQLNIFCSYGQHISVTNFLMSSYIHFISGPNLIQVFSHQNESQIVEQFKQRNNYWPQKVTKWMNTLSLCVDSDGSHVTNLMIPSFRYHCIGIVSEDSYELKLVIQTIDFYRLATLLLGLIIFNLGPKISRSILFYYISCASVGTFASFLIIFLIIGRFFPKKISGLLIILGSSAIMCATRIFWETLIIFLKNNALYVLIYAIISTLLSIGLGYRFGPVTNQKTLNLMQWFLQLIGLTLIGVSSQIIEYSCIAILSAILWKVLPIRQFLCFPFQGIFSKNEKTSKMKKLAKIKLLTESEYEMQSDIHTKKALEELKSFCLSNECNAWGIISKLKDPIRFARFINGENEHISDNEIMVYENSESSHSIPINNYFSQNLNNNEIIEDISEDIFRDSFEFTQNR